MVITTRLVEPGRRPRPRPHIAHDATPIEAEHRHAVARDFCRQTTSSRFVALAAPSLTIERVAEHRAGVGHLGVEGLAVGNVSPSRRRDAVRYLLRRHPCRGGGPGKLVGPYRSTQRYVAVRSDFEGPPPWANERAGGGVSRWGCRRIWGLLRQEGIRHQHEAPRAALAVGG